MNRILVVLMVVAVVLVAFAPVAVGAPNQPSRGENSTDRAAAGSAGPHCHLLIVDSAQGAFDNIQVFPSHKGHDASGLADGVFMADLNCDGLP